MGFNKNDGNARRDTDTALAAGKGLFIFVRMVQHTFSQYLAGAIDNTPGVSVMIPTCITVAQGSTNTPSRPLPGKFCFHHFSIVGHRVWQGCQQRHQ